MKPNDFILNSDYLSIAQADSKTYTVYVGGGTLQINGYSEQNFNFTTSAQAGAIDRVLIKKDSDPHYTVSPYISFFNTEDWANLKWRVDVSVYRTSKTNLRVNFIIQNYYSGTISYPSMTFTIKVSSFRPPNVF